MSSTNTTPKSFKDIVEHSKQHFTKKLDINSSQYVKIFGLIDADLEKSSHFEIYNLNQGNEVLCMEFHIEGDYKTEKLQTAIKYWKDIYVFEKKIEYDPKWQKAKPRGRLRIKFNYSEGTEKIFVYIDEFIYQVKSRIDNLVNNARL